METFEVILDAGGSIELAVDVKWLEMTDADLKWVRGLVDQVRSYEQTQAPARPKEPAKGTVPCNFPGCDRVFTSTQGRQVHFARAHGRLQPVAEKPATSADDSPAITAHRLADISRRGDAWQAMCLCGEFRQAPEKNDARELLREHCDAA